MICSFYVARPGSCVALEIKNLLIKQEKCHPLLKISAEAIARIVCVVVLPIFLSLELCFVRLPKMIVSIGSSNFYHTLDKVIKISLLTLFSFPLVLYSPKKTIDLFCKQKNFTEYTICRPLKNSYLQTIEPYYQKTLEKFEHREAKKKEADTVASPDRSSPLRGKIEHMVISGGGAKAAVLPGAFKVLLSQASGLIEGVKNYFGSSAGAISSALLATGLTLKYLHLIGPIDFDRFLEPPLVGKSGENLVLCIRQMIRINILHQLRKLSSKKWDLFHEKDPQMAQNIISQLKEKDLSTVKITFRMLNYLHSISPENFKNLTITSTEKKNGAPFIFNYENTPDEDIAFACRVSASMPIIFQKVRYSQNGKFLKPITLFDGGLIYNVPVIPVEELEKSSPKDVGNKTLILLFEDPISDFSAFDKNNVRPPYIVPWQHKVTQDFIPRIFAGIRLKKRTTVLNVEALKHIKEHYPHIMAFPVDIEAEDFEKASRYPKKFFSIGEKCSFQFLKLRDWIQSSAMTTSVG